VTNLKNFLDIIKTKNIIYGKYMSKVEKIKLNREEGERLKRDLGDEAINPI